MKSVNKNDVKNKNDKQDEMEEKKEKKEQFESLPNMSLISKSLMPMSRIDDHQLKTFIRLAEMGDTHFQVLLGESYLSGLFGLEKNAKEALKYLKMAKNNNAKASYSIGECYKTGTGVKKDLKKAFEYYLHTYRFDNEFLPAQEALGLCYLHGLGVPADIKKGIDLFRMSAEKGHCSSQVNLSNLYRHGIGVEKDYKKGVEFLEMAAKKEYPSAYYYLGYHYLLESTDKDEKKAFEYFQMAAKLDHPEAQYFLALFYLRPIYVEMDNKLGYEWLEKSANHQYSLALSMLGVGYRLGFQKENGGPVTRNLEKAFQLFKAAAQQGHIEAMINVAWCTILGEGVKKDAKQGYKNLNKIFTDSKDVLALYRLGNCYQQGLGTEEDGKKAFECYELAVKQNFVVAQNDLGQCYLQGIGVNEDPKKAIECFEKGVNLKDADSITSLGLCYINGLGVSKAKARGYKLIQENSERGNRTARYHLAWGYLNESGFGGKTNPSYYFHAIKILQGLIKDYEDIDAENLYGICHLFGQGIPKNDSKAVKCFQRATEKEHAEGRNNLSICYLLGRGIKKQLKHAFSSFNLIISKSIDAQNNVGWCYLNGLGVEKNVEKALEYFKASADKGNIISKGNLAWCYLNGIGTAQDRNQAQVLFKELIESKALELNPNENGSIDLKNYLGISCFNGTYRFPESIDILNQAPYQDEFNQLSLGLEGLKEKPKVENKEERKEEPKINIEIKHDKKEEFDEKKYSPPSTPNLQEEKLSLDPRRAILAPSKAMFGGFIRDFKREGKQLKVARDRLCYLLGRYKKVNSETLKSVFENQAKASIAKSRSTYGAFSLNYFSENLDENLSLKLQVQSLSKEISKIKIMKTKKI